MHHGGSDRRHSCHVAALKPRGPQDPATEGVLVEK